MINKAVVSKTLIPDNKCFLIKEIVEPYFDPIFHSHPEYQLSFVLKGEGNRFVGNSIQAFYSGDMVLVGPNLPHVWKNHNSYFEQKQPTGTTVLVLYFKGDIFGDSIAHKAEFQKINMLLQQSSRGLEIKGETRQTIGRMMRELTKANGLESVIQLLKILDHLAASKEIFFINELDEVAFKEAESERIHKVYDFVMKNFNNKIKLEEVAEIANMTNTSFSRYFKSRLNKSFSDFLKDVRINYACKLLKDERIPIESISYDCGYPSVTNFNKQFKHCTGKQPSSYREEFLAMINTNEGT